jgi:hypothetical protein
MTNGALGPGEERANKRTKTFALVEFTFFWRQKTTNKIEMKLIVSQMAGSALESHELGEGSGHDWRMPNS